MAVTTYAFAAFAAIGAVSAASSSCSHSGTTTLKNAAQASAIATACSTYTGSIAFATDVAGAVAFTGGILKRIEDGDLRIVDNQNISSLAADRLTQIDGEFRLENAVGLFTLTIPMLSTTGSIYFSGLSSLQAVDGTTNISKTGDLTIQNTKLSTLTGFNLESVSSFNINNNLQLQNVTLPLKSLTGDIALMANGERAEVAFPNLQSARNISIQNCVSLSLPKLETLSGQLSITENANLANVSVPELTSTDDSVAVNNNTNLQSISFPQLQTVGGALDVQKNPKLGSVSFPKVTSIKGSFDVFGNFTKVSLPDVKQIAGAFNVQTSKTLSPSNTCDNFESDKNSGVIKGNFTCADQQTHPSNAASTPSGSGAQTVRTSSPAMPAYVPLTYTGLFGVVAAMFGLM